MITLNTNYEPLKDQINYIQNHMLDCKTPNEAVSYLNVYQSLVNLYYLCTGEICQDKKINRNRYATYAGNIKRNEITSKCYQNYLNNKEFHKEMFAAVTEMSTIWNEYYENNRDIELYKFYQRPFDEKREEEIDVLNQFFLEKDVVLKEIFEDLQKQGAIFLAPNPDFYENRPVANLNSVENKVSVFIPKNTSCNVSFLASLVHELAHARDFFDLSSRGTPKIQQMYIMKSFFTEVLSTEYQMDFYEFLIGNNIHKEEAQLQLLLVYDSYLDSLEDAWLYSSLPDDCHHFAITEDITRKEAASLVNPESEFLDQIDDTLMSDFYESLEYSYGILFSYLLSHNPKIREQFLTIRHDYFDPRALGSIGMTKELVSENVNKQMKTYFKS